MRIGRISRMVFYKHPQSASSPTPIHKGTKPTPGDIHHRLEHQRHTDEKHHIIDIELRRAPLGRRSTTGNGVCADIFARGRSRVRSSSSFEGSGGRCGESSIESIEGVDSLEPGEKRSHLIASIARPSPASSRGDGNFDNE